MIRRIVISTLVACAVLFGIESFVYHNYRYDRQHKYHVPIAFVVGALFFLGMKDKKNA